MSSHQPVFSNVFPISPSNLSIFVCTIVRDESKKCSRSSRQSIRWPIRWMKSLLCPHLPQCRRRLPCLPWEGLLQTILSELNQSPIQVRSGRQRLRCQPLDRKQRPRRHQVLLDNRRVSCRLHSDRLQEPRQQQPHRLFREASRTWHRLLLLVVVAVAVVDSVWVE